MMAPQTSCPTLRVGQWQMTRCLPAVWCLMLSACVGQHNVMSSVSASFLTPGSLASMVGDVWSDGLTVYYCCHLVTKQSKVCGHRRPDPCCGVTTCDCSQARLSPLAPNLLLMRGGQQTQGREPAGQCPGQYTQCSPEAQKMLSTRRRPDWQNPTDGVGIVTTKLSRSLVRVCAKMVEYALCGLGL